MTTPTAIIPPASTEIRVLVAICHNLSVVDRRATQSLIEIGYGDRVARAKATLGIASIDMAWFTQAPRVDVLRNIALEQGMRDGFTHIVFLDGDMIFPTDTLERLLRHIPRGALVSGFYTMRRPPYAPIAMRDGQLHECGKYSVYRYDNDYEDVDQHGLREEEVIGMGCALVPLDIVARIGPKPWFHYKDDADGWPQVSEDVPFCERVRAAGFQVFLDPSIKCGHLFSEVADERFYKRYLASMQATEERMKGVVTIKADEAPAGPAPKGDAVAAVGGGWQRRA